MTGAFSAEETQGILDTWGLVRKDLKSNGVAFFIHFFTGYPEYQQMFKGMEGVPLDELKKSIRLKSHAFTVMKAIDGLVDNLDDVELLSELLIKTGKNHQKRNLTIQDIQNLRDSLLDFFGKALGDAWTSDAESGWKKALAVIVEKFGEGLNATE